MNNIVQNKEKAYGYNYSSLASLAAAGIEIPKMRTVLCEGKQFVQYLDETGEWQMGAEVVVPDMKGMNAAQAYGSALTYARRYTVMMARSVACTDDQLLEAQEPKKEEPKRETPPRRVVKKEQTPAPEPVSNEPVDAMICEDCGQPITPVGKYGVMEIAQGSYKSYGRYLCWDCSAKAKAKAKKGDEQSA